MSLNPLIAIPGMREHSKASEKYVDVVFTYGDKKWHGSIPTTYRRTGLDLETREAIEEYLNKVYEAIAPGNHERWKAEQAAFWAGKSRADVTKAFFDRLQSFEWTCVSCQLPANPNWARRVQDLKEFGYTLATNTSKFCNSCAGSRTHLLLLPLPRGGETGYEVWSPALRKRILSVLGNVDVYEGKVAHHLLPDHKFPEIRWDSQTRRENIEGLTDAEIRQQFQLLNNQRNQQKREICRTCAQTGTRGYPFGIKFYYAGDSNWPTDVPRVGKAAEAGCFGCGWYDLGAWRAALSERLRSS